MQERGWVAVKTNGAKGSHAVAWSGSRGAVFQWLLAERPTPERRVEAHYLQRTRFESVGKRKVRRRQLTEDRTVEINGRDLR